MINIALIDIKIQSYEKIYSTIKNFNEVNDTNYNLVFFYTVDQFLCNHSFEFAAAIVSLDMDVTSGLTYLKRIRQVDHDIALVIKSNDINYAIKGYEYNILSFLEEDFKKDALYNVLLNINSTINEKRNDSYLVYLIKTSEGLVKAKSNEIKYIEVDDHYLYYHVNDEIIKSRQTIKEANIIFAPYDFELCNQCYLVNLEYVEKIIGNKVIIQGEELLISRPKKKTFLYKYRSYLEKINKIRQKIT